MIGYYVFLVLFAPEMSNFLESAHQITSESTKFMHETEFDCSMKVLELMLSISTTKRLDTVPHKRLIEKLLYLFA